MVFLKTVFYTLAFCVIMAGVSHALVKVSFKTLNCDGSKGFASVQIDSISKVTSFKCDKGSTVKEVYQILVETGGAVKYNVYNTSEKQAGKIQKAIDSYQNDKQNRIKDGGIIILY